MMIENNENLLYIFKQACLIQNIKCDWLDDKIIPILYLMQQRGGIPISLVIYSFNPNDDIRLEMCISKENKNVYCN